MNCAKCQAILSDGSAFCNHCGASQSAATAALPAPPPPKSQPAEEDVWKGRFSGKSYAHYWMIWVLYGIAIGYLAYVINLSHAWMWWTFAGFLGVPAFLIAWMTLIQKISVRYRLTNYRLFKTSGIISRMISEVELIRVDDVAVRQNLLQRIFNVGVVTVISTDATDPTLNLSGIDNPVEVKEKIRTHVRERRSRVVNLGQVG